MPMKRLPVSLFVSACETYRLRGRDRRYYTATTGGWKQACCRRRGRPACEDSVFPVPAGGEQAQDLAGIVVAVAGAVVVLQGERDVAVSALEIVGENRAAKPQVGARIEEIVARLAGLFEPERHDLHQPLRAGGRDGPGVEIAFGVDNGEHQCRRHLRLRGFSMDGEQQFATFLRIGKGAREPRAHGLEPDLADRIVLEAVVR